VSSSPSRKKKKPAERYPPPKENDFLGDVIKIAHLHGWTVSHFRSVHTPSGWRTPVQADGTGFPDLVLVRHERLIFAELKVGYNKLTDAQTAWRLLLLGVASSSPNIQVEVWRPADWDRINSDLR